MEPLAPGDTEGLVLRRPGHWVVAAVASWCGFCRTFRPKFEAREGAWSAHLGTLDLSDLQDPRWDTFGIRVVPTLLEFRDGRLVSRIDGRRFRGLKESDLDEMGRRLAAASGPSTSG